MANNKNILDLTLQWWGGLGPEKKREYMDRYDTGSHVTNLEKIHIYTDQVVMIWWHDHKGTLGKNVLGEHPRYIGLEEITSIYLKHYNSL